MEEIEELFQKELAALLNKFNKDSEANTPDFMLAEHLSNYLKTLSSTIENRAKWFGHSY